jgi:hypothetical protein
VPKCARYFPEAARTSKLLGRYLVSTRSLEQVGRVGGRGCRLAPPAGCMQQGVWLPGVGRAATPRQSSNAR